MQSKRFDEAEVQTIPTLTGINTLVLENSERHRVNFHGIRFQGRIHSDTADSIFQHGYITLLCVPNDQVVLSGIFNVNDMIDWNQMIIAIKPFSMFSGAGDAAGYGATFDFDIAPKTSRTCSEGGKIVAQVTNVGLGSVILTTLLTLYSTTV